MPIYRLSSELVFPNPEEAEDGIVAIGGDLSVDRLLLAYKSGLFPWFSDDEPIIWWCPDPRFVLFPNDLKISKSMQQLIRKNTFTITTNTDFESVIKNCRNAYREGQDGTWITDDMINAYTKLNSLGIAHSVEVWLEDKLVGGLYGLLIGKVFFGESMFFKVSNASKIGFIWWVEKLKKMGVELIDCQVETLHLKSLGANEIKRKDFLALVLNLVQSK